VILGSRSHGTHEHESKSESYVTTVSQSTSLSRNKAPIWGLRPDFCYCQIVAGLLMSDALSEERTCLSSPAQSFLGPSPVGLATIFYCLRFKTFLFVASYDSQDCRGGIRPRLHTHDHTPLPTGPLLLRTYCGNAAPTA
jgi:hypothetical protein